VIVVLTPALAEVPDVLADWEWVPLRVVQDCHQASIFGFGS